MYDGVLSGKPDLPAMPATAMSVPAGMTANLYCSTACLRLAAFKTYKWQDCRTLLNWGKEHFNHEEIIGKTFL